MTIVITTGAILLILALVFLGPIIEIFGPLLFWLGAVAVVIISSLLAVYFFFQGELFVAAIFSIPFWIAIYWAHKQEDKEPVSRTEKLAENVFEQMISKYQKTIASLVDKPDELEKYVKQFEAKFSIGEKMGHLLGALEWESTWNDNGARKWRYTTVSRKDVKGEKDGEFELNLDGLRIAFSKAKSSYDYNQQQRTLEIYDGKKKVAEYSCYRHRDAYYDWGESGTPYMSSFKPGKWLEQLNNLYIDWKTEKAALEEAEKQKQKLDAVKDKYL